MAGANSEALCLDRAHGWRTVTATCLILDEKGRWCERVLCERVAYRHSPRAWYALQHSDEFRMSFLGPAINRTRLWGAPKSAESKSANATRSGCAACSSLKSALVAFVATFSKLHDESPRSNTSSTAQRIMSSPLLIDSGVRPLFRAIESSVHGVLR